MIFSNILIDWYLQNKRSLPWRNTKNPYPIWLSEIILQQTRVAQGLPYFEAFTTEFKTIFDLANASEEQVLKLWQGLGYYSRARNLHAAAKYIVNDLNGVFPPSYKELLHLKGVGEYTAAAIASFAYDEPVAVVDGNVFRVLSRVFGIETDISSSKAKKEFQELAQELLPVEEPAFNTKCVALQQKKVDSLPVKLKKTKVRNRYFNYLIIKDKNGDFVVEKREEKGIWFNLYQFNLLETKSDTIENIVKLIKKEYNPLVLIVKNEEEVVHKLSHQHLHIRFFELQFDEVLKEAVSLDEMMKLPFPIVIHNFIESNYL
jgi:A/G-specific adenine glycosylase